MHSPIHRIDYSRYKQQLVLYTINVYQPCTVALLRNVARASTIGAFKQMEDEELQRILDHAEERGLLVKAKNDQLHLTHLGLRLISKRRLAFVRDKNRLFYLKDVV